MDKLYFIGCLHYYAFSAKLITSTKYSELLSLCELQTIYQSMDDSDSDKVALMNVNEISKKYLDIVSMFEWIVNYGPYF